MNLKETIKQHPRIAGAVIGSIVLGICLLLVYITAPSDPTVPQGTKYEVNANIEQQKAITDESVANAIANQRIEAKKDTAHAKQNLQDKKDEYQQVHQTNNSNGISGDNLDARERKLLSDLERLYPANR